MSRPPASKTSRIAWVRQQQNSLWRYLRLLGARAQELEDVMQDAFVALFRSYPNETEPSQVHLLRTIARRRLFELRRRRDPAQTPWSDEVDAWLAERDEALSDDYSEAVTRCLAELSPRARRGLTMRHVEDCSVNQIATALGIQRTGALTLLQRSRDLLRACLSRHGHVSPATDSAADATPDAQSPPLSRRS